MDIHEAEYRYLHDSTYRHLVESIIKMIETLQTTPSEIREAVMFAQLKVELRHPPKPFEMLRKQYDSLRNKT